MAGADREFVHGLTAEDFVVSVNGRERPVQIPYEIDLRGFDRGPELARSPRNGDHSPFSGLRGQRDGQQALLAIADGTGDMVKWQTNIPAALASIERETAAYYMVGHRKESSDPPPVEIQARARPQDVRVTWAPEHLTPPPAYGDMTPEQPQLQFADVLAEEADRPGLQFDARVIGFPAAKDHGSLEPAVRIPAAEIEALAAARGDANVQLELAAFVRSGPGRTPKSRQVPTARSKNVPR